MLYKILKCGIVLKHNFKTNNINNIQTNIIDSSNITWRVIMKDAFLEFNGIIDEEIQAYEALEELYKIKQNILVQGKSDVLWDIDAQIIDRANVIRGITAKRKECAKYIGSEELTLSEVIEKAKESNNALAPKLEMQKNKLKILAKTISLLDKTNMTLVKHGLTMVGKTFDIIVGVLSPQSKGQYDKHGQNIKADKSFISSVVEDA